MENGDLGCGIPSSRHKESISFHNKSWRCEGEAIAGVHEVLVEQVAVLVLLHAGVEQAGPVGKAEFADGLLEEVEVLVGQTVLGFQLSHCIRLGENYDHIEPQIPRKHPFVETFQGWLLLTRAEVRKRELGKGCRSNAFYDFRAIEPVWWVSIAAVTRESRDPAQSNFPIASTFLNIKPHSMVVTGKNRCLEIDKNLLAVRAHDQRIMEGSQDDPKKQRLKQNY